MEITQLLEEINKKIDYLKYKIDSQNDEAAFELLKLLVLSPSYPTAVDESLICDTNNEDDKAERGRNIIEIYIDELIEQKSFLDFGCGEGHVAESALEKNPKVSVGYDIKSENFNKKIIEKNPTLLTSNWDDVAKNKYDVILMYDVFDHLENETTVNTMTKIKSVLAPNGKIYARMHPFISRHSNHYYHTLNKAFLHLVFTDYELEKLTGVKPENSTQKIFYPVATYNDVFKKANLTILSQNIIENYVDKYFFDNKIIKNKILKRFNFEDLPIPQMSMSFVDYVLS